VISPELEAFLQGAIERLSRHGFCTGVLRELPYGVQIGVSLGGSQCLVNLYHSRKKGVSAVPSGNGAGLHEVVIPLIRGEESSPVPQEARAGTDEAGKGDYFGPLVVAAVFCSSQTAGRLSASGVADSKKLAQSRIQELYRTITEMEGLTLSVVSIPPREYNSLFASYSSRGMNSLDIQAMAHGRAICELLEKGAAPKTIVIDRFCEMKRLQRWLPATDAGFELVVRAEDREPAVAAASIVARSVYVDELRRLSTLFKVTLSPGAGAPVDETGRELVAAHGAEVLLQTAKVHFSNTGRITRSS
jgi:ribonuclease HIII